MKGVIWGFGFSFLVGFLQIGSNTVGFYFVDLCLPLTAGGPSPPALNLWLATPCELRNEITRLFGINGLKRESSRGSACEAAPGSGGQELSARKELRQALRLLRGIPSGSLLIAVSRDSGRWTGLGWGRGCWGSLALVLLHKPGFLWRQRLLDTSFANFSSYSEFSALTQRLR